MEHFMDLDAIDRRILDELQRDGAQSAADVAAKLGLSNTTCWRRIQQLEQEGVIKRRVALLDRTALGLDVMVYVHVRLNSQGRDALAQFERAIRDRPEVLDCCTLTGEWDFHLRIVTQLGTGEYYWAMLSPTTAIAFGDNYRGTIYTRQ